MKYCSACGKPVRFAGVETESVALFSESEIPWDEIAFSSVRFTLKKYFATRSSPCDVVHVGGHGKAASANSW